MKPEIKEALGYITNKRGGTPVTVKIRLKESLCNRDYWDQDSYTLDELKVWLAYSSYNVNFNIWREEFYIEDECQILASHNELKTALEIGLQKWKDGALSFTSISY